MLIRVYCILLVSIISCAAFSQEADYNGWYKRADALFNSENPTRASDSTATALFLKAYEPAFAKRDGKIALESLIKAATIRQTYGEYEEACGLYRRSLALNREFFHDTARLYYASLYLGTVFYQQGTTDSARHYFEDASRLLVSTDNTKQFPEQERLYNSLGAIYFEIANYQQAINY